MCATTCLNKPIVITMNRNTPHYFTRTKISVIALRFSLINVEEIFSRFTIRIDSKTIFVYKDRSIVHRLYTAHQTCKSSFCTFV